jgi:hypothetical protein
MGGNYVSQHVFGNVICKKACLIIIDISESQYSGILHHLFIISGIVTHNKMSYRSEQTHTLGAWETYSWLGCHLCKDFHVQK